MSAARLEIAASADAQREYERNVPIASVPNEMIAMWEDQVIATDFAWYSAPVFTHDENAAIRAFHIVWEQVADETPDPMPPSIETLIGTEPWGRLADAARHALGVFALRGRFSDDAEEPLGVLGGKPSNG